MPFDISLVPDKELRPWADCKELDDMVDKELENVNDILSMTSPIKNAGFQGMSELDMKAQEFIAFQNLVEQPGWMGFDEPEVNDILDEDLEVSADSASEPMLTEDPAIVEALNKLNNLTATMRRNRMAGLRTMHLMPVETMRGKKKKKRVAAVKHNPHASFSPAFRAASARGMSRDQSRSGFESDIDVDFYSIRGNEDSSLFFSNDAEEMAAPSPSTSILEVLIPKSNLANDQIKLKEARNNLVDLIDKFASIGPGATGNFWYI